MLSSVTELGPRASEPHPINAKTTQAIVAADCVALARSALESIGEDQWLDKIRGRNIYVAEAPVPDRFPASYLIGCLSASHDPNDSRIRIDCDSRADHPTRCHCAFWKNCASTLLE